ncbi:MAG: class I SAM-dependent methyltransferase [Candidatus Omnitrophica bacterium]|nr:class I SAM-dependent methyltransferase [Candidatus Omnitrophota bacterium]
MKKNQVKTFFNKYAVDFSLIYGGGNNFFNNFINNYFRKSMKVRFIKTIQGCQPLSAKKIIDIGCGAGHYEIALAKEGAQYIYAVDFAKGMVDLAKENVKKAGFADKCRFDLVNFISDTIGETFDYAILMGFMDYIKDPKVVIKKVLSITKSKAFFSFPVRGGILAWQRKLRYKNRCDLFFYDQEQIYNLFEGLEYKNLTIEKIGRDFFVTVTCNG